MTIIDQRLRAPFHFKYIRNSFYKNDTKRTGQNLQLTTETVRFNVVKGRKIFDARLTKIRNESKKGNYGKDFADSLDGSDNP